MPTVVGIDRIKEEKINSLLKSGRLGVITAVSGISSDYRYTADILTENFRVSALLAPEHGIWGALGPGEKVDGGVDKYTGIPTYSLYKDFLDVPGKEDQGEDMTGIMDGIDIVVFDMQDVGSRYFTYASTLFCAMQTCAKVKKPLVLLDRPNPIGGRVEGNCLDMKYSSYIGMTSVPIRHGMTLGELARFYNGEYGIGCDLHVVEMNGWSRDMYFENTQIPFVKPSPNLPTMESIVVYNGTCMLSGTNMSEGRGTTSPFTSVGAPYIDPYDFTREMNGAGLKGVKFSPALFIPSFSKYPGELVCGVNLHVTDRDVFEPVRTGVTLIRTAQRMYPNEFSFRQPSKEGAHYHIDLSTGNTDVRDGILSADEIMDKWNAQAEDFAKRNAKYLLY